MEGSQTNSVCSLPSEDSDNTMVCFCYRLTKGDLKKAYRQYGSLAQVEEKTRAGQGCAGCKIVLQSLFNETPSNLYHISQNPLVGTACAKPGSRIMRCFVIANGDLESTVYSSNGIAPQLGECDSSASVDWALIDHRGQPVLYGNDKLKTDETFTFTTKGKEIPRPLYGQFLLRIDRSNFGASRFNVHWSNGRSTCSTHENSSTGRPNVFFPLLVTRDFLHGPNTVFLGMTNPHAKTIRYSIRVFDVDSSDEVVWEGDLPYNCSMWLNANEHLYAPFLSRAPSARATLQIKNHDRNVNEAITTYFFLFNRDTGIWSANHL